MSVSVIIPAYQASEVVGATVRAVRSVPGIDEVIVVDDGSRDGTAGIAREAGADQVITLDRNRGKGAALRAGTAVASGDVLLFLDADLGESARHAGELLRAHADTGGMAIAVLPSPPGAGGVGLLRGLASLAIWMLAGLRVKAPLSGQRALPARLARHAGIASGFGVEVGLTVEAAHLGWPVVETPVPFTHRATGRTLAGFWHRGRQFRDVLLLVLQMAYGLGWPALTPWAKARRLLVWLLSCAAVLVGSALVFRKALGLTAGGLGLALILWPPALAAAARWPGLRKPNYLGRVIPVTGGMVIPPVVVLAAAGMPGDAPTGIAAAVALAMGAVGLLDDLFGSRGARGLRGHLRALLRGRLTTGMVKAMVGVAVGVAAGWRLHPGRWGEAGLDGLVIALSANAINLLDLRPGRALKFFLTSSAIAGCLQPHVLTFIGPTAAAAVVIAPAEFGGRVMIGDLGANVLGALLGLALACALGPWGKVVAAAVLLGLHLACEKISLTELFSRNVVLRALDRLGTQCLPPLDRAQGPGT